MSLLKILFTISAFIHLEFSHCYNDNVTSCKFFKRKNVSKIKACFINDYNNWNVSQLHTDSPMLKDSKLLQFFDVLAIFDQNNSNQCFYENNCDIVLNNLYPMYFTKYYNNDSNDVIFPINFAINNNPKLLSTWYDSINLKHWMISHNLSKHTSKKVDLNNPAFPLILTNNSNNQNQQVFIDNIKHFLEIKKLLFEQIFVNNRLSYSIEYMQLYEGDIYGSSLNGELLSTSCIIKMSDITTKLNLYPYRNVNNMTVISDLSNDTIASDYKIISCGSDIIQIVQTILKLGNYSGSFCMKFSINYHLRIIIHEIYPFMCERFTNDSKLFLFTYVPLSFKILNNYLKDINIRNMKSNHPSLSGYYLNGWYNNILLKDILKNELQHIQTGNRKGIIKSITDIIIQHKQKQIEQHNNNHLKRKKKHSEGSVLHNTQRKRIHPNKHSNNNNDNNHNHNLKQFNINNSIDETIVTVSELNDIKI